MARLVDVALSQTDGYVRRVLNAQAQRWGAPLKNHLMYARRPALFKAVRGMWNALNDGNLLDEALVALVNRRVAWHNNCVF